MSFRPQVGRAPARLLAVIPVVAAILGSGLTQPGVAAAAVRTRAHVHFLKPTAGRVVKDFLNSLSGTGVISGGVTFGNATVGGSTNAPGTLAERKRVNSATPSVSGRVTKLSIYLQPGGATGTQVLRGVIYAGSAGSPGALLAVSNEQSFTNTLSAGWYDLTFPSPPAVTAGTPYWIGFITGATATVLEYRYNSVAGSRAVNSNTYASGPSDPFGASGAVTVDDQSMSLYGTIVPNGAPVAGVAPALSDISSAGRYQLGDSLTTTTGTWSNGPTSYTYQWQDCTAAGVQCSNIPATSSTYALTAGDVGGTVRAVVTATNAAGSTSADSATSIPITSGGGANGWSPGTQTMDLSFNGCNTSQWDNTLVELGSVTTESTTVNQQPNTAGWCAADFLQNSNSTGAFHRVELSNYRTAHGAVLVNGGQAWYQWRVDVKQIDRSVAAALVMSQFRETIGSCYTGGTQMQAHGSSAPHFVWIVVGGSDCSHLTRQTLDLGPFNLNQWYLFQLHYIFSPNASVGLAQLWLNGTLIHTYTGVATHVCGGQITCSANNVMFRQGIYAGNHSNPDETLIDDVHIYAP